MWVFDAMGFGANVINGIQLGTQLSLLIWLVNGGLVFLIRAVSWQIDSLLLSFITRIYTYFVQLLEGKMFNEEVVSAVMRNIYIFIGVIIFFRLMMVIISYIVNPELVNDGKVGANQLVKRVIIGLAGIILVPTIFTFINNFQAAVLKDQVIQRIIVPEDLLEVSSKKMDNAGAYIGSYVLSGFVSPSANASNKTISEYNIAVSKGSISTIDVNRGAGFLGVNGGIGNYEYGYFFFLSTFVLGYVLFLMAKYCLDIAIRFFKLFLYQLIAPIAMIEYMINGSQDGVFKNWRTSVISSYCMIFTRVFALWFVIFVMTLMGGDLPSSKYTNGSLLAHPDYLLRAIIMIALLAFMMDLPKIIGQVFGLDLEQESSATGLLNSIKGGIGKITGAGLAMGGAFAGGLIGSAKGLASGAAGSGLQARANSLKKAAANETDPNKAKALSQRADALQDRANKVGTLGKNLSTTSLNSLKGARQGMMKAAMGANQYTNAAYSGYSGVGESVSSKQKQREEQEHQTAREAQEDRFRAGVNKRLDRMSNDDLAKQATNSAPRGASYEQVLTNAAESKTLATAQENGFITTNGTTATVDGAKANVQAEIEGHLKGGMEVDAVANVVSADMGSKLGVSEQTVKQIVQTEYAAAGGISAISGNASLTASVSKNIVDSVYNSAVEVSKQEVAPSVRKEYGNRTMTNIENTGDRIVDSVNTQGTNVSNRVDEVVNRVENVDRNVSQTNTTLNNINTNVNRTNTTLNNVKTSIDVQTRINHQDLGRINDTTHRIERDAERISRAARNIDRKL